MYGHDKFCATLDKHLIRADNCSNCCRAKQIRIDEREKILNQIKEIDWTVPFEGHGGFYVDDKNMSWVNQSLIIEIVKPYGTR